MTATQLNAGDVLARVADTLETRRPENGGDPQASYAARLLAKGPDAFLKKIGEEATELVMAAKDGVPERIVSETADLWFHCLVALTHFKLRPEDVLAELARREGLSGLAERPAAQGLKTETGKMSANCIFCKIAAGEIPAKKVYEDEDFLCFHDINPAAPVHLC